MSRLAVVFAASLALVAGAAADEGWGVQFHFDPFEGRTYPMAAMKERTEGIVMDAANIFMVCRETGIAVIFQPERYAFNFGNAPVEGRFLSADGPVALTFTATEVPYFKGVLAVTGADADKFTSIFSNATAPVAYQTDKKTGAFPIAGFADVLPIMKAKCG